MFNFNPFSGKLEESKFGPESKFWAAETAGKGGSAERASGSTPALPASSSSGSSPNLPAPVAPTLGRGMGDPLAGRPTSLGYLIPPSSSSGSSPNLPAPVTPAATPDVPAASSPASRGGGGGGFQTRRDRQSAALIASTEAARQAIDRQREGIKTQTGKGRPGLEAVGGADTEPGPHTRPYTAAEWIALSSSGTLSHGEAHRKRMEAELGMEYSVDRHHEWEARLAEWKAKRERKHADGVEMERQQGTTPNVPAPVTQTPNVPAPVTPTPNAPTISITDAQGRTIGGLPADTRPIGTDERGMRIKSGGVVAGFEDILNQGVPAGREMVPANRPTPWRPTPVTPTPNVPAPVTPTPNVPAPVTQGRKITRTVPSPEDAVRAITAPQATPNPAPAPAPTPTRRITVTRAVDKPTPPTREKPEHLPPVMGMRLGGGAGIRMQGTPGGGAKANPSIGEPITNPSGINPPSVVINRPSVANEPTTNRPAPRFPFRHQTPAGDRGQSTRQERLQAFLAQEEPKTTRQQRLQAFLAQQNRDPYSFGYSRTAAASRSRVAPPGAEPPVIAPPRTQRTDTEQTDSGVDPAILRRQKLIGSLVRDTGAGLFRTASNPTVKFLSLMAVKHHKAIGDVIGQRGIIGGIAHGVKRLVGGSSEGWARPVQSSTRQQTTAAPRSTPAPSTVPPAERPISPPLTPPEIRRRGTTRTQRIQGYLARPR